MRDHVERELVVELVDDLGPPVGLEAVAEFVRDAFGDRPPMGHCPRGERSLHEISNPLVRLGLLPDHDVAHDVGEGAVALLERLLDHRRIVDDAGVPEDLVGFGKAGEGPRAVEQFGRIAMHGCHAAELVQERVELTTLFGIDQPIHDLVRVVG